MRENSSIGVEIMERYERALKDLDFVASSLRSADSGDYRTIEQAATVIKAARMIDEARSKARLAYYEVEAGALIVSPAVDND